MISTIQRRQLSGFVLRGLPAGILVVAASLLSLSILGQSRLTDYGDVREVSTFFRDVLPPELQSSDEARRRKVWGEWIARHDREIRRRLLRGEQDSLINWLLFGTSFTTQPRAFFDASGSPDALRTRIAARTKDLISALASADMDERVSFARQLLVGQGYGVDTVQNQARLERFLYAEVDRVVAERQQYMAREDSTASADVIEKTVAQSSLFQDRGLSLDTSILASFAIDQALETIKDQGLLAENSIRRVAIIGPGLDFADKNSGYDFYPVQTLQPFTTIDSLLRTGLASAVDGIALTTLDISPRVNEHIRKLRDDARRGTAYTLRLPADQGALWTLALENYWKRAGERIGSEAPAPDPPPALRAVSLRAVRVRPQVGAVITPADFNIVSEEWSGPPFDLVIATNVLVYYDRLDQTLAFAGIERMLRPGGLFVTNNLVVELPVSQLRAAGLTTIQHSAEAIDRVFWYRRNP